MDVKELLYAVIDEIGKENIQMRIASNIDCSSQFIESIISRCILRTAQIDDNIIVNLAEALLHFMLTVGTLPSERKVSLDKTDIDIVIPGTRVLKKDPAKSIVIQYIEEGKARERIAAAEAIQPRRENIWVISARALELDCINYTIYSGGVRKYSDILNDISSFLSRTGDNSLKFLHS